MDHHSTTILPSRSIAAARSATAARVGVTDAGTLALAYTPGVGRVSQAIADDREHVWRYTGRSNSVAVLTNGTAVLGLGDIGPEAALPVMEGKALLFHRFAGIDAVPICAHARSVDELVALGTALAPTFGGINLEDIAAPACFEVERRLQDARRHPGVPRRPARHGHRRRRRRPQRRPADRQARRRPRRDDRRDRCRGHGLRPPAGRARRRRPHRCRPRRRAAPPARRPAPAPTLVRRARQPGRPHAAASTRG